MKISILLPFKEDYSKAIAGAVSLFVKDTFKHSKYKKNISIFGSTLNKDYLSKNYINLPHKKTLFKSNNAQYVNNFLSNIKFKDTEILEIHNRPNYISLIKKNYKNKIFLYFHNDPLSMNGSKTIRERLFILNNVDKLIFNSEWSKKQFFTNLNQDIYFKNAHVCFQSTNKVNVDLSKKKKIITFIGKLNKAKGYDIFGETITEILKKYNAWSAYVIGNERREKIHFYHKRLFHLGFKNNSYILNFLKKSSISIVCSRWNEPFGRASLEASSRGSATIISNKGGLPETSKAAIKLKTLSKKELKKEISILIENPKKLYNLQKKNIDNFFLTHQYVSRILDKIRNNILINKINIHLNKKFKIMHITNFNERFNGRLQYNTGRRINNGLIRLGHNVLTISDRDVLNYSKGLRDLTGKITLQKKIISSYLNFKPDLLLLGHADNVSHETLEYIKQKNVKIAQWFLDPLSKFGPDYKKNKTRILDKKNFIDASFLTTDPNSLDFKLDNSFYIPNPCDESFEILENYKNNCEFDLFFAMSHGVHRGQLKSGKIDNRELFIEKLIKLNKDIKFDIYGMKKIQPIWGDEFIKKISNSSMGLNLSRGKPIKYYSSDRIAQLIGNGLLTFIDSNTKFQNLLSKNEVVFYNDINDLSYKLNKYKKDKKERIRIAKNGKKFYFKYFNSKLVSDFILQKTFQTTSKKKFIWN